MQEPHVARAQQQELVLEVVERDRVAVADEQLASGKRVEPRAALSGVAPARCAHSRATAASGVRVSRGNTASERYAARSSSSSAATARSMALNTSA